MSTFITPEYRNLLEHHELDTFERIWTLNAGWFEEPNKRRGGWSGVGRLALQDPAGRGEQGVFLKRQENHTRRTFLHPFRGEPTFSCEFKMMNYLARRGVPVPKPVFFAQQANLQAALMTEELVYYTPLDAVTEELFESGHASLATKRSVLRGVAASIRKLHQAGIQHRSLYPKHLFVKFRTDSDPDVVIIDLEKSRRKLVSPLRTVYDLATLHRHARYWSRSSRLYFFKQYMEIEKLSPWSKFLCRMIHRRSDRRHNERRRGERRR